MLLNSLKNWVVETIRKYTPKSTGITVFKKCKRNMFRYLFENFKVFKRRILKKYFRLTVTNGNLKLKNSIETRFVIWNLPAKKTCPFRTEHCSKDCYACKSEIAYPDCLPIRENNLKETFKVSFIHNMVNTIEEIAEKPSYKNAVRVVVRIHESGDFYSKTYFAKWLKIAETVHEHGFNNVIFMAYTKSIPFIKDFTIPEYFKIRASIWDDTRPELVEMSKDYPIYTAYDRQTIDAMRNAGVDFHECRCSDCGTCNECWSDNHKLIICEIH